MTIGTTEAAYLLGICPQRVKQLLYEGRIIGAKKVGRYWQIPIFKGMPKIKPGTRGPKSGWRKLLQRTATIVHVNQNVLKQNRRHQTNKPPIIVKSGSKINYYHQVKIAGSSQLVYQPEARKCNGATLWLEIDPTISVIGKIFSF
ncbi:MAG: DNA-binding protein [Xenococcaceae cyanobacterium]